MARKKKVYSFSSIRKEMKKKGANVVARNAVDILNYQLQGETQILTQKALGFAKHAGRSKISEDDMRLAIKYR